MKYPIIVLFVCFSFRSFSQEFHFKATGEFVHTIDNSNILSVLNEKKDKMVLKEYRVENGRKKDLTAIKKAEILTDSTMRINRFVNNQLMSITERKFIKLNDSIYSVTDYYSDGNIRYQGECLNYFPLIKHGNSTSYYSSNKIRAKEYHLKNKLITNDNWLKDGTQTVSDVYGTAEIYPTFLGSIEKFTEYIQANLQYPEASRNQGIEGRVYVEFIVTDEGRITGVQVMSGLNKEIDNEAIRVIEQSPSIWKPGLIDNNPINMKMILPIGFNLN